MAISKKRAPSIKDADLNRVITRIYDDLNEIINAVNQSGTIEDKGETVGKEGDIRIAKSGSGYEIQGRTSDGWASATINLKDN